MNDLEAFCLEAYEKTGVTPELREAHEFYKRHKPMTTDSTMTDLERRAVQAVLDCDDRPSMLTTRQAKNLVRAALKAHAEWLEEHDMRIITLRTVERQPFVFDPEDIQQEDQHNE